VGIGWGGMGEGLGRWKVAVYGVSLGIDFANLDCQKTAKSGLRLASTLRQGFQAPSRLTVPLARVAGGVAQSRKVNEHRTRLISRDFPLYYWQRKHLPCRSH
jgi:hypothetical protein